MVSRRTPDELGTLIREGMLRAWLDDVPSPDCFDVSEARMDLLTEFLSRGQGEEASPLVVAHLLTCSRCRFLYTRLRLVLAAERSRAVREDLYLEVFDGVATDPRR